MDLGIECARKLNLLNIGEFSSRLVFVPRGYWVYRVTNSDGNKRLDFFEIFGGIVVDNLFVNPTRQGIGSKMLSVVESTANSFWKDYIFINATTPGMRGLCKKRGYELTSEGDWKRYLH